MRDPNEVSTKRAKLTIAIDQHQPLYESRLQEIKAKTQRKKESLARHPCDHSRMGHMVAGERIDMEASSRGGSPGCTQRNLKTSFRTSSTEGCPSNRRTVHQCPALEWKAVAVLGQVDRLRVLHLVIIARSSMRDLWAMVLPRLGAKLELSVDVRFLPSQMLPWEEAIPREFLQASNVEAHLT